MPQRTHWEKKKRRKKKSLYIETFKKKSNYNTNDNSPEVIKSIAATACRMFF